jgi:hypothetical protein
MCIHVVVSLQAAHTRVQSTRALLCDASLDHMHLCVVMVSVVLCYAQARSGIVAVLDIGGRGMTCSLVDVESGSANSSATPWGRVVATERCDSVGGEYIEELLVTEVSSQSFRCTYCYCNYHYYCNCQCHHYTASQRCFAALQRNRVAA